MKIRRKSLKSALCIALAIVQVSTAFAGTVRVSNEIYGRSSHNFLGFSNVKAVVSAGTEGEVLDRALLPSGSYGIRMRITTLDKSATKLKIGDEVWVYFHKDTSRRRIELFDDDHKNVANAKDGKWARATSAFRTPYASVSPLLFKPAVTAPSFYDQTQPLCAPFLKETRPMPMVTSDFMKDVLARLDAKVEDPSKKLVKAEKKLAEAEKKTGKKSTEALEKAAKKIAKAEKKKAKAPPVAVENTEVESDESDSAETVPDLDFANEEVLSYLNSENSHQPQTNAIIARAVVASSKKYDVPIELILGIMHVETDGARPFKTRAVSHAGARGLMQVMRGTWKGLGGGHFDNAFNPTMNVDRGVKYLADLLRQFKGNKRKALASYNAGPNHDYIRAGVFPKSIEKYVNNVLAYRNEYVAFAQKIQKTSRDETVVASNEDPATESTESSGLGE